VRILIAPDKFKGTLSAREVAEAIATGLRDVLPAAKIDIVPMADGGEGTAEVISKALGASWIKCKARDPIEREIDARYAWIDAKKLAVMEMSEAAGMRRLKPSELNPEIATTFGVGEMILDATKRGAGEIIIGLGGSATNDGGFGMARALGFRFFDVGDNEIKSVSELTTLNRIETPSPATSVRAGLALLPLPEGEEKDEGKAAMQIVAAVDVRNPLLGEDGATRVFGPQKGVAPDKVEKFESSLLKLAEIVAKEFGFDYRNEAGAGAAGGLGFGLMSFCGARIRPGFDVVAESVALESRMKSADIVITGEGSLDRQTLEGKTPAGVAQLAHKLGKRVFALVGRATEDPDVRDLFDVVYQNARSAMSTEENMKRAAELLQDNARQLARDLKKTIKS
jgi:glycerate kinase